MQAQPVDQAPCQKKRRITSNILCETQTARLSEANTSLEIEERGRRALVLECTGRVNRGLRLLVNSVT